jgi:hypothetical protein
MEWPRGEEIRGRRMKGEEWKEDNGGRTKEGVMNQMEGGEEGERRKVVEELLNLSTEHR